MRMYCRAQGLPGAQTVKNLPVGDLGSAPQVGKTGGGHVNPLHYSCLENPMDRGA